LEHHQQQHHHNTKVGASSTTTTSQHEGWSIININTRLEIFSMKLASQQHQHEAENLQHKAGISTTSTRSWKSSALGWNHNNINTAGNIQHWVGITTTSARRWKSSALGWHHNNINMKLEIFSMRLASQQHQHEAGNLQH
jgi:hypothetical protein